MTRRTAIRITTFALIAVAVVTAWAVFVPPELGGSTRYVILEGTSMEPSLHAGDLALVRAEQTVGTGDVVLYEHPKLGAHVLHRIVRERDGRFTLKGDNNDFLDGVRPSNDEVLGKLWVAIPKLGSPIAWSRQPLHAALIVFTLAFVALGGVARRRPSRARRRSCSGSASVRSSSSASSPSSRSPGRRPTPSRSTTRTPTWRRSRTVPRWTRATSTRTASSTRARPRSSSSSPSSMSCSTTGLEAKEAAGMRGSAQLTATLSDGIGWSRSFPVGEPTEFEGVTAQVSGILDLAELVHVVDEMKSLTGSGTSTFAVDVTADVDVSGRVGGESTSQSFTPTLPLTLDTVSLRPEASDREAAELTVRRSEALVSRAPASRSIGRVRLSITSARRLSVLVLVLALLVAAFAGAVTWRERGGGEPSQIAALFGDRLITLSQPPSADRSR